jgi:hypothetical protein
MVPTKKLPSKESLTSQFTPVLLVPDIVALNCCVPLSCTLALVGEIETETATGVMDTVALAEAAGWATLWAVTVTVLEETAAGAL